MSQLNKEACENLRRDLKGIAETVRILRSAPISFSTTKLTVGEAEEQNFSKGEVWANMTLAYRHIEDASMRLGKAIQALDGGASVYDKSQVVGAD